MTNLLLDYLDSASPAEQAELEKLAAMDRADDYLAGYEAARDAASWGDDLGERHRRAKHNHSAAWLSGFRLYQWVHR